VVVKDVNPPNVENHSHGAGMFNILTIDVTSLKENPDDKAHFLFDYLFHHRSANYDSVTGECSLSDLDRHSTSSTSSLNVRYRPMKLDDHF